VINLNGQKYPGGPSAYETAEMREDFFRKGLTTIASITNLKSVAFNYRIGCGIAGGNWAFYSKMIENFEKEVSAQNVRVAIYRREQDL
jgi:hypothetical protein